MCHIPSILKCHFPGIGFGFFLSHLLKKKVKPNPGKEINAKRFCQGSRTARSGSKVRASFERSGWRATLQRMEVRLP